MTALSQGLLHAEKCGRGDQPTPQVLSQETWGGAQESQCSGAFQGVLKETTRAAPGET